MAKIEQAFVTQQIKLHGEIRKVDEVVNTFPTKDKDGNEKIMESRAVLLKVDDDDENRVELFDKNSDNLTTYRKGQVGTFTLRADLKPTFGVGNYEAKMLIIGFEADCEQ